MGVAARFMAVLVAVSVMIVLITPASDELPCTVGHRLVLLTAFLATATSGFWRPTRITHWPAAAADRLSRVADVLSLSCTLLC